jgi:hypothetical protein
MAVFITKLRKTHNTHTDKIMTEKRTIKKNLNTTHQAIAKANYHSIKKNIFNTKLTSTEKVTCGGWDHTFIILSSIVILLQRNTPQRDYHQLK